MRQSTLRQPESAYDLQIARRWAYRERERERERERDQGAPPVELREKEGLVRPACKQVNVTPLPYHERRTLPAQSVCSRPLPSAGPCRAGLIDVEHDQTPGKGRGGHLCERGVVLVGLDTQVGSHWLHFAPSFVGCSFDVDVANSALF